MISAVFLLKRDKKKNRDLSRVILQQWLSTLKTEPEASSKTLVTTRLYGFLSHESVIFTITARSITIIIML
jgi:hypothetical protein